MCLAAHADWSVQPGKRWMSVAAPAAAGWRVRAEPVGDVATLLRRLQDEAGLAPVALGVDAPIGLPRAYAALRRQGDFAAFLTGRSRDDAFFRVCDSIDEVSPERPFFPRTTANAPRRAAHAARLGLDADALLRRCDASTPTRPRAAALFWTLGANQVGKASIALWRDLLLDAPRDVLWPFGGSLATLLRTRGLAIAETYPAEAMRQLGLRLVGSKRRQADRLALAPAIGLCLARLRARPDPALAGLIATGFGADSAGEDRFDSLVGLLGLLQVLQQPERDVVPAEEPVRRVEGWILGQALPD